VSSNAKNAYSSDIGHLSAKTRIHTNIGHHEQLCSGTRIIRNPALKAQAHFEKGPVRSVVTDGDMLRGTRRKHSDEEQPKELPNDTKQKENKETAKKEEPKENAEPQHKKKKL
jgi:hypothetical protein